MERLIPALALLAVVAGVFALMALGWRARRRRQSGLPAPAAAPAALDGVRFEEDLLYVATTKAGEPLERIAVAGLGFRGRAGVAVADDGVRLDIAGEPPVFIPAADLDGVGRATWTLDRVVDQDGLVFLRWRLGETPVDSYLRSADPDRLVTALEPLTHGRSAA
jgi:hypothetical protein